MEFNHNHLIRMAAELRNKFAAVSDSSDVVNSILNYDEMRGDWNFNKHKLFCNFRYNCAFRINKHYLTLLIGKDSLVVADSYSYYHYNSWLNEEIQLLGWFTCLYINKSRVYMNQIDIGAVDIH